MPTLASMVIGVRRENTPDVVRIKISTQRHKTVYVLRSLPKVIHCALVKETVVFDFECEDEIAKYYKFIKLYSDDELWRCTIANIDIGYHEERLTPLDRLRAKMAMPKYWDIPF